MRTDGSDVHRKTSSLSDHRQPTWSVTGLLVYVVGPPTGPTTIWKTGPDGTTTPLTSWLARNRDPVWGPLGQRLLFSSNHEGAQNIYSLAMDSGEVTPVTKERFYAGQPSWSPDGRSLVFTVRREGNWDIYRSDLRGKNPTRLTSDPARDWFPAWSPGGDRIAFVSNRTGTSQLYVMKPDGTEQYRLTDLPNGVESPSWSPSGRWLAFTAHTGEGEGTNARELYLIRVADGHQVRLTYNAFDDTDPAWRFPPPSVTGIASLPRNIFLGEYYANVTLSGSPAAIRLDPEIDFNWGTGPPANGLPADYFSVRWLGRITASEDQDYLFTVEADAGVRLWVDGNLLLDGWTTHSAVPYSVPTHLTAGDHTIRLEYYEDEGVAHVSMHWSPVPGVPGQ